MANINSSLTLGVKTKADTSDLQKIRKEFEGLVSFVRQNQLTIFGGDDENVQKTLNFIRQVETSMTKAYNPKVNSVNVKKFNDELKKSNLTLPQIKQELYDLGPAGIQAFGEMTQSLLKFDDVVKKTSTVFDRFATTMGNTIKWGITSTIWNNMTGAVQKSVYYVKDLDAALNDIRIVTGKSNQEMAKFAQNANKAAKELAVSTKAYAEGSLIYYQQGLNDETVQTLTEITAKTANVTKQSMSAVSEQLTAVWNGYQVANQAAKEGMEVYEQYVDKMAAVAATTASNLEELSTGMSKVASAASAVGITFDDLVAQTSTIVSVTRQAPENVGTALKTIYARMGDLKVDGVDEFGTKLGEVSTQLKTMGIEVVDSMGNMRNMSDVITEVAMKWDSWTEAQRQAAAIAMAGKRQYNNLIALFNNWDKYTEALNTSLEANGTLMQQQYRFMDSLEAKQKRMKTAAEELYGDLFDSNSIGDFYTLGEKLLGLLDIFVKSMGGLKGILMTLGPLAMNVFSKQIAGSVSQMRDNMLASRTAMEGYQNKINEFKSQMTKSDGSLSEYAQKTVGIFDEIKDKAALMGQEENETLNTIIQMNVELKKQEDLLDHMTKERASKYSVGNTSYEEKANALGSALAGVRPEVKNLDVKARETDFDTFLKPFLKNKSDKFRQSSTETHKGLNSEDFRESLGGFLSGIVGNDELIGDTEFMKALSNRLLEFTKNGDSAKQALTRLIKELEEFGEKGKQKFEDLNAETKRVKASTEELGDALKKKLTFQDSVQNLMKTLGALGQIANSIRMITDLGSVWASDASPAQKVYQTITTISITLPLIVNALNALNSITAMLSLYNDKTIVDKMTELGLEKAITKEKMLQNIEAKKASLTMQTNKLQKDIDNGILKNGAKEKAEKIIARNNEQLSDLDALSRKVQNQQGLGEKLADKIQPVKDFIKNSILTPIKIGITSIISKLGAALTGTIVAAITAATAVALIAYKVFDAQSKRAFEQRKKDMEELQKKNEELAENKTKYQQYLDAAKAIDGTTEAQQKLEQAADSLGDAIDNQIVKIAKLTGNYDLLTKAVEEANQAATDEQNKNWEEEYKLAGEQVNSWQNKTGKNKARHNYDYYNVDSHMGGLGPKEKTARKGLQGYFGKYFNGDNFVAHNQEEYMEMMRLWENLMNDSKLREQIMGKNYAQTNGWTQIQKLYQKEVDDGNYDKMKEASNGLLTNMLNEQIDKINSSDSMNTFMQSYEDVLKEAKDKFGKMMDDIDIVKMVNNFFKNIDGEAQKYAFQFNIFQKLADVSNTDIETIKNRYKNIFNDLSIATQGLLVQYPTLIYSLEKIDNQSLEQTLEQIDKVITQKAKIAMVDGTLAGIAETGEISADTITNLFTDNDNIGSLNKEAFNTADLDIQIAALEREYELRVKNQELNEEEKKFYEERAIRLGETKQSYETILAEVQERTKDLNEDEISDLDKRLLSQLEIKIANISEEIDGVNSVIEAYTASDINLSQITQAKTKAFEKDEKSIKGLTSAFKTLSQAMKEYKQTGGLTIDTVMNLLDTDNEYLQFLESENGQLKLNTQAAIDYMTAKTNSLRLTNQDITYNKLTNKQTFMDTYNVSNITDEEMQKLQAVGEEINKHFIYYANNTEKAASLIATVMTINKQAALDLEASLRTETAMATIASTSWSESLVGAAKFFKAMKFDDEFDRYWDLNKNLNMIEKAMNRLEKIQSKLHGSQLIASLKNENQLLAKQEEAYRAIRKEQLKEQAELQKSLGNFGVTFGEQGEITNYAALTRDALAKMNAADEAHTAEKMSDKEYEQIKAGYDEFKKQLSRYDALYYEEMEDNKDKIAEITRKQLENKLQISNLDFEVKVKLDKAEIEFNNFLKEMRKDVTQVYQDIGEGYVDLIEKNFNAASNVVNNAADKLARDQAEVEKWKSGDTEDSIYGSLSEAQAAMEASNKEWMDANKELKSSWDEYYNTFIENIEQIANKVSDVHARYDEYNDTLDYQKELIELLYGPQAYDQMSSYYETRLSSNAQEIEDTKLERDNWEYLMSTVKENSVAWQKYNENRIAAQKKLNELTLEHIKLVKEDYQNTVNKTFDELEKSMNGGLTNEEYDKQWAKEKAEREKYYDNTEKIYELNTLSNGMQKTISNAGTLKNQQRLQELYEKEIKILREKDKLTKYDVDAAKKKFEIMEKEMALEDAKNNKNSMKLTRGADGNWSYQYVVDEDKVTESQQAIEDSYHDLYEMSKKAFEDNLEEQKKAKDECIADLKDIAKKYSTWMQEINLDQLLSEEEKAEKIEGLNRQMHDEMQARAGEFYDKVEELSQEAEQYRQDNATATVGILKTSYETNQDNYNSMTDEQKKLIDAVKDTGVQDFLDIEGAIDGTAQKGKEKFGEISSDGTTATGEVKNGFNTLAGAAKTCMESSGSIFSSTAAKIISDWSADKGESVKAKVTDAIKTIADPDSDDCAIGRYKKAIAIAEEASGQNFANITDAINTTKGKVEELSEKVNELFSQEVISNMKEYAKKVADIKSKYDDLTSGVQGTLNNVKELLKEDGKTVTITVKELRSGDNGSFDAKGNSTGKYVGGNSGNGNDNVKTFNLSANSQTPGNLTQAGIGLDYETQVWSGAKSYKAIDEGIRENISVTQYTDDKGNTLYDVNYGDIKLKTGLTYNGADKGGKIIGDVSESENTFIHYLRNGIVEDLTSKGIQTQSKNDKKENQTYTQYLNEYNDDIARRFNGPKDNSLLKILNEMQGKSNDEKVAFINMLRKQYKSMVDIPSINLQGEFQKLDYNKYKISKYDTGGYTGAWNSSSGKLAVLHEKELVLNKDDTARMLEAVKQLRAINEDELRNNLYQQARNTMMLNMEKQKLNSSVQNAVSSITNNNFTVHADFSGLTDAIEIKQALLDLPNYVSQITGRDVK